MVNASTIAEAFSEIALGVSAVFGGPYFPAKVLDPGVAQYDTGGSIIPGTGAPTERPCMCQVDVADWVMRQAEGFVDGDARFLILSATLTGALGTSARVQVTEGPNAGIWMVSAIDRDPGGAYWQGRGREA